MLVVYAKLVIDAADRRRIDALRAAHDPQETLVEPHFTLVFPFAGVEADEAAAHVRAVARRTPAIDFRLTRTAVVTADGASYVFLVPAEGEPELRRLHERLHAAAWGAKLTPPTPFLPHVTVAAVQSAADAERIAAAVGPVAIAGRIERLDLAELDGPRVRGLHSFPLA